MQDIPRSSRASDCRHLSRGAIHGALEHSGRGDLSGVRKVLCAVGSDAGSRHEPPCCHTAWTGSAPLTARRTPSQPTWLRTRAGPTSATDNVSRLDRLGPASRRLHSRPPPGRVRCILLPHSHTPGPRSTSPHLFNPRGHYNSLFNQLIDNRFFVTNYWNALSLEQFPGMSAQKVTGRAKVRWMRCPSEVRVDRASLSH